MDDHYEVEVLVCHACAARERKAYARHEAAPEGQRPVGEYYFVHPEEG